MSEQSIAAWCAEIDAWCHSKGWRDLEVTPAENIALIHSEASEALEALRDGHAPGHWYTDERGKPEGPASEIADVVIRCFDWAAKYGVNLEEVMRAKQDYNQGRPYQHGGRRL